MVDATIVSDVQQLLFRPGRVTMRIWTRVFCLVFFVTAAGICEAQEIPLRKLVVGTRNIPPFSIKNNDGSWTGLSIELWQQIASELQLPYEFRELKLSELLQQLESEQLDAVVAATTVTAARETRIDFSHPFFNSHLGVAIRKNDRKGMVKLVWQVVVWPLLWVLSLVLSALVVVGTMIWLAERKRNPEQFGGTWIAGVSHGLWWAAVTMTTVGYGDKTPLTLAGKVIALAWMLIGVVIIALFTAFVTSRLTAHHLQTNLNSIRDLVAVKTGAVAQTTSDEFLRTNGISRRLFDDVGTALTALDHGEVDAVVYDRPILRYMILQDHPDLQVLDLMLGNESYAFAFPSGSPLREPVNRKLLEQIESTSWKNSQREYLGW